MECYGTKFVFKMLTQEINKLENERLKIRTVKGFTLRTQESTSGDFTER